MNKLEHALDAIDRGFFVFPLVAGSKVPPKGNDGYLSATRDRDRVTKWWTDNSNDNIGIATEASQIVVIDLDVPKGPEQEAQVFGMQAWIELVSKAVGKSAPEPRTYEVWTPSGGEHLYWRAPASLTIKTVASKLAPGVDVRAGKGSIVAVGSTVPSGEYELHNDIEPQPMPSWLGVALIKAGMAVMDSSVKIPTRSGPESKNVGKTMKGSAYGKAALAGEINNLSAVGQGGRNYALNATAYRLGRFIPGGQLDEQEVVDALTEAGVALGLSNLEVSRTVKSGLEGGKASPLGVTT